MVRGKKMSFFQRLWENMKKNWILYAMILPVAIYYIIFAYAPMYGIQLAFKDYQVKEGIMGSPWVGLEHFIRFFKSYNFGQLLKNTIGISVYSLLVGFPIPIIFALMLNYLRNKFLKKTVQMVSYAPYFISTVVMCGMIAIFMNPDTGILNVIRIFSEWSRWIFWQNRNGLKIFMCGPEYGREWDGVLLFIFLPFPVWIINSMKRRLWMELPKYSG